MNEKEGRLDAGVPGWVIPKPRAGFCWSTLFGTQPAAHQDGNRGVEQLSRAGEGSFAWCASECKEQEQEQANSHSCGNRQITRLPYRAEHWPTGCSSGTGRMAAAGLLGCWAGLTGLPGVALASKFLGCSGSEWLHWLRRWHWVHRGALPESWVPSAATQRDLHPKQTTDRGSSALALAWVASPPQLDDVDGHAAMGIGMGPRRQARRRHPGTAGQQLRPYKEAVNIPAAKQNTDPNTQPGTSRAASPEFRACPGLPHDSCLLI